MMENYSRMNLITRFKCSKCGNQLSLAYRKEEDAKGRDYENDNITGANKVENDVFIEPCQTCVEKPQKELDTLRNILKG